MWEGGWDHRQFLLNIDLCYFVDFVDFVDFVYL